MAAAKAAPSNKILTMSSLAMTARAFMPAKATAAVGAAERLKPEPKPAVEASPPPLVLGSGAGAGRPTASARPASSATSTSSPSKATHLGELAASAVRVGKAATGGPTTAAAAAAIEVASAAAALQRNAAQQRAAADGGRRIVVDSSGVGHVERTRPRSTVPPRSTQRGLTASPRASQAREFIANAAR
ncbi:MAG: hypothetical protein DI537_45430 [Stutzerimonas stutzeri]|nr:MAG: hypothetical protein DI537_45430 [Stutzerimonas stutzeri]